MSNPATIAGIPLCSASGNVTAETAFGLAPANAVRAAVSVPAGWSNSVMDGRELALRVGILVTTGGALTWRPGIRFYQTLGNTNLTTFNANDTLIINPAAQTISTATALWTINARLAWDPTTGAMTGSYESRCGTVNYAVWAALTANVTANMASASLMSFFVTGIFGTTQANNTAVLKYAELDLL
jgi:hypothetical protein